MTTNDIAAKLARLVHEADVGRIPLSMDDRRLIEEAIRELKVRDGTPWIARVSEILDDSESFWRSCSGCHELNDGAPTGDYSAAFRCHVGVGCQECGGLGVIWDATDYSDLADFLREDEATQSAEAKLSADAIERLERERDEALNALPRLPAKLIVNVEGLEPRHHTELHRYAENLKRMMADQTQDYVPEHGWTCFHCGLTFTTFEGAEAHFGIRPVGGVPQCLSTSEASLSAAQAEIEAMKEKMASIDELTVIKNSRIAGLEKSIRSLRGKNERLRAELETHNG